MNKRDREKRVNAVTLTKAEVLSRSTGELLKNFMVGEDICLFGCRESDGK